MDFLDDMFGNDDLLDEVIAFDLLGGFDMSDEEKLQLADMAEDLGLDPNEFESWEDLAEAVNEML